MEPGQVNRLMPAMGDGVLEGGKETQVVISDGVMMRRHDQPSLVSKHAYWGRKPSS